MLITYCFTGVAQAAAEFLNYKMIDGPDLQEDDSEAPAVTGRGGRSKKTGADNTSLNHRKLRTVVQFFHESEVRESIDMKDSQVANYYCLAKHFVMIYVIN